MRICASLNLKGRSLEAMRFYSRIFNSQPEYFTYADMPPDPAFPITDAMKPLVMHGEVMLDREQSLIFADDMRPGGGVIGDAISFVLMLENEAELRRIYSGLAEGGERRMEPGQTFWSACYGEVKDRYGLVWGLNLCQMPVGGGYMAMRVELPEKRLVGQKIRSTMKKASEDCAALWEKFTPRMAELPAGPGSYGVSTMFNPEEFEYFAAVEAGETAALPAGMERFTLPGGTYAKCYVPHLSKIHEAYNYFYSEWPKTQTGYVPDYQAPSFEFYPADWSENAGFELFIPIKKA